MEKKQLAAGQVDSRLIVLVADLETRHQVRVAAFGDASPGVTETTAPLRSADLVITSNAIKRSLLAALGQEASALAAVSPRSCRYAAPAHRADWRSVSSSPHPARSGSLANSLDACAILLAEASSGLPRTVTRQPASRHIAASRTHLASISTGLATMRASAYGSMAW